MVWLVVIGPSRSEKPCSRARLRAVRFGPWLQIEVCGCGQLMSPGAAGLVDYVISRQLRFGSTD